jgi:hypothetical protein
MSCHGILSIAALESFLIKFCKDEIGNLEKQTSILTSFTDYVLSENVNRWRNIEPFITHGELRAVWNSFFFARPQSLLAKKQQPGKPWKTGPSRSSSLPEAGGSARKRRLLLLEDGHASP